MVGGNLPIVGDFYEEININALFSWVNVSLVWLCGEGRLKEVLKNF